MKIIKKEIKPLPIDTMFEFKPQSEALPDSAQQEIADRLFPKVKDVYRERQALSHGTDWHPMNDKGSLSKRLKSYMYKHHSVKLSDKDMEWLGTVITKNSIASKEYALDITEKFEWSAGDFGDNGSCFFGCRSGIRQDMMDSKKYKALRFFKKDYTGTRNGTSKYYEDYAGIGRSWIWKTNITVQLTKLSQMNSDVYVVFNGYGPTTQWQASFLSAYLGLPMKYVALHNKGSVDGGLYVNDGSGYVIGEEAIIKDIKQLDFGLKTHYCQWE